MNSADFLSTLLTGAIIIGYPLVFLLLLGLPFWVFKHLLKKKITPVKAVLCLAIGLALDYGWFKLGILGLKLLQGFAFCDIYNC